MGTSENTAVTPMVPKRVIVLDTIRSTHNVGAIFRTADGAGIDHVYLVGYTPQPVDRFGREVSAIAKTALGAEKTIPWTHFATTSALLHALREEQLTVVAIEQVDTSRSIYSYQAPQRVAYVFGNEIDGVQAELCAHAAAVLHIPMCGVKESLNVSVSVGIALYVLHPSRYDTE